MAAEIMNCIKGINMNDVIEMPVLPTRISIRNYVMRFDLNRLHKVKCQLLEDTAIHGHHLVDEPKLSPSDAAHFVVFVPEGEEQNIFCMQPATNSFIQMGLVVAIGKNGRDITAESASDYVFGYAVGLQMVYEEDQDEHCATVTAKTSSAHTFVGPITVASQFDSTQAAELSLSMNNDYVQKCGSSIDLCKTVGELIESLSKISALESGDLIFVAALEQSITMKSGDTVLAKIDSLGKLHAKII